MAYEVESSLCGGVLGAGATPEAALQSWVEAFFEFCPSGTPLATVLGWDATGEYWAPVYGDGDLVGELRDTTGTPLTVGSFEYQWLPPEQPATADNSFEFMAAIGLVVLFALGYIGGHQR